MIHKDIWESDKLDTWLEILLVILAVFVVIFLLEISVDESRSSSQAVEQKYLPYEEYRTTAIKISYKQLIRNPISYSGERVCFSGKVVQRVESGPDTVALRVATKKEELLGEDYYMEDILYLNVYEDSGSRILENDIIYFCGKFLGLKSYQAIFGNEVTIPEMNTIRNYLQIWNE